MVKSSEDSTSGESSVSSPGKENYFTLNFKKSDLLDPYGFEVPGVPSVMSKIFLLTAAVMASEQSA